MYENTSTTIHLQIRLKIHHNVHFSLKIWRLLKTRLHSTRAKQKRCYDVMLSRQEVNTLRHLANAQYWDRPAGGNRKSFSGVWRAGLRRPD